MSDLSTPIALCPPARMGVRTLSRPPSSMLAYALDPSPSRHAYERWGVKSDITPKFPRARRGNEGGESGIVRGEYGADDLAVRVIIIEANGVIDVVKGAKGERKAESGKVIA